jgi:hypothetical protein
MASRRQYRVRNVDSDAPGPHVTDDYRCRAAEMQRPDIDFTASVSTSSTLRCSACAALWISASKGSGSEIVVCCVHGLSFSTVDYSNQLKTGTGSKPTKRAADRIQDILPNQP